MAFADPLPWWALTALVLAAAGVAVLAYWRARLPAARRAALAALRCTTLLLLVCVLMRPVARHTGEAEGFVPILVDSSRSMGIEDVDGMRRIDRARTLLAEALLPALGHEFEAEVFAFGESLVRTTPDELAASARRSDLAGALQEIVSRHPDRAMAGIVLLSDGGQTAVSTSAERSAMRIPVFPIGIGSTKPGRDREVLGVTVLEAILDDSRVDLAVSAVSHGYGVDPIELRLLENGKLADVRRVRPAADGTPVREVFPVSPDAAAPTVYTVEIPVSAGELVPENNARSVLVPPVTRARRVLLVQGAPGFEHSFLRRAWSTDPGIEVDAVVRQGRTEEGADTFYIQAHPSRSAALASGFPASREALFAYDAVVLANVDREHLATERMEALRDFVGRRGGGLLVLGARAFVGQGLRHTPLEDLLPLDPADRTRGVVPAAAVSGAGRSLVLTAAGAAHPMMRLAAAPEATRKQWDAMPPLPSVAPLGAPRPGATVLAVTAATGGANTPVVAVQRFGEGRSMVFAGEAAWQWRMRLPSDDRRYDTFWRQAIRWIALPAQEPDVISAADGPGDPDRLIVRIAARTPLFEPQRTASAVVRIAGPDGQVDTLPAEEEAHGGEGVLMARSRTRAPGVYRIAAEVSRGDAPPSTSRAWMLAGGVDHEMADPRLNLQLLERIANASGGRVVEAHDLPALVAALRAARPAAARRIQRDIWHNVWFFGAILTLVGGEWMLRRRWGLR